MSAYDGKVKRMAKDMEAADRATWVASNGCGPKANTRRINRQVSRRGSRRRVSRR